MNQTDQDRLNRLRKLAAGPKWDDAAGETREVGFKCDDLTPMCDADPETPVRDLSRERWKAGLR